jgi:O-antigen/teichoic acid export membrane protein
VAFASLVAYTRLLSPEDYGAYVLVITTVSLVQIFLFRWLELSLLRLLPAAQGDPGPLLSTVLWLYIRLVAATAVLGIVAWLLLPVLTMRRLLLVGLPILWALAWLELNLKLCQSALMPVRYGVLSLLRSISTLCVGVALVLYGFGAYGPLLGLLLGTVLACFFAVSWLWRGIRPSLDRRMAGELARYGLPLTGSIALVFVIDGADRFMIAGFLGVESVGAYSAAHDLASQSIGVLMMAVNLAATPLAIRAYESGGVDGAVAQLRHNATFLLAIALPAALGIVFLADPLADVLLGQDYRAAAKLILPWVALAIFLGGLKVFLFDMAFQLSKRSGMMMWSVGAAAVCNVLLNFWWIPSFGTIGAVWASVASYALGLVICIVLGRRLIPIQLDWSQVSRVACASVVMVLVIIAMPDRPDLLGLSARIFAGMAVYGLGVALLNVLNVRTYFVVWLDSKRGR